MFHGVLDLPKKDQATINSACLFTFTSVRLYWLVHNCMGWGELARARLRWTREFDLVPPKDTFYKDHEAASCGRAHACFCLVKFVQLLFI